MDEKRFQELLSQARQGDKQATDSLLVSSFDPLRAAIVGQMGDLLAKAQVEPEDVIQEVFAAAWTGLKETSFEGHGAFQGWLRQIAEHKLIDLHRAMLAGKRDVRRQTPAWGLQSGTYVNVLEQVTSPMSTPSVGAARSEAMAVLMSRLAQLPEDYRRVIQWRLIEGVSVAEVARRMERSEPAVHMLFHRALKQLRDLMGSASDFMTRA